MSAFSFVDEVSEVEKGQSITAFFTLKGSEEFLLDHFDGFPVMPGVLLLESLKQAACRLLEQEGPGRYRLAAVKEVKFGQFVKPQSRFEMNVRLTGRRDGRVDFTGRAHLNEAGQRGARVLQAEFSLAGA